MVLGTVSALGCILCCLQQVLLETIRYSTWNSVCWRQSDVFRTGCTLKQCSMVLGKVSARKLETGCAC